jgi:cupin fold WbuC family metalloprotein
MIKAKAINNAVYIAEDQIVHIGQSDIEFLKSKAEQTDLKRTRLCAHKNIEDPLQEMIITFAQGSYIRPSKHIGKEESIHIIEGRAEFVFFDEEGNIIDVIPLGDFSSGREFYCRTPESTYHTVLIQSDRFVVQETTQGPFRKSDTLFAPWAPEDGDVAGVKQFIKNLILKVEQFKGSQ